MKKILFLIAVTFAVVLFPVVSFAEVGDMGFFGGISEGRRLPKTTQRLLAASGSNSGNRASQVNYLYKELIFLSGEPVLFEGILSVSPSGGVLDNVDLGSYTETYRVSASATTKPDASVDRFIVFDVNWRRVGQQIIKDYTVRSWSETVATPESVFTIDPSQSYFGISIIEDRPAAVTYYRGDVSQRAVYTADNDEKTGTTLEAAGSFYGYSSAWSNTETHRIDYMIYTDEWQVQYQVRPSVSVNKILEYTPNEPSMISFPGNYKEVLQNESGLSYDIFVKPQRFHEIPGAGSEHILIPNTFEQLIAPSLSFLRGHPAEDDIKKLFAMQVLEGETTYYKPEQAITRGQFVTALVKAIRLPVEPVANPRSRIPVTVITFPDVLQSNPDYPYIMAAYKAGVAVGRSNGYFYADADIERQEALVMMLRALGLENLGYDPLPVTAFADDGDIKAWAKRELYAADRIGLIAGDTDGKLNPKDPVSKAEAAALLNRLIEYIRSDLKRDYADHIVNNPN